MGLDMYLKGEDFLPTYNNDERPMRDGFPVETYILHIKAWRKFAPLHCHIVNVYSDEGHDDCEPIRLTSEDLRTIADVIRHGDLPPDEECHGFFFGTPEMWAEDRKRAAEDAAIFDTAADWLDRSDLDSSWRSVIYQASW
jgi:hypothetical protein